MKHFDFEGFPSVITKWKHVNIVVIENVHCISCKLKHYQAVDIYTTQTIHNYLMYLRTRESLFCFVMVNLTTFEIESLDWKTGFME
jgi:hypothetical protein